MGYKIVKTVNGRKDKVVYFGTKSECYKYFDGMVEVLAENGIEFINSPEMFIVSKKEVYITYKIYKDNE